MIFIKITGWIFFLIAAALLLITAGGLLRDQIVYRKIIWEEYKFLKFPISAALLIIYIFIAYIWNI
ncbi:MAG: hypothetical protein P8Y70_06460 [Candidatus Lokiarchaeota archaeon]